MKYIITGRPITKKNSVQRTKFGVIQSKQYRAYEKDALWQLWSQGIPEEPIDEPCVLHAYYTMPTRQGWPDLIGLLQATCDLLEKAEIIADDRLIVRFEDSRIVAVDKEKSGVEVDIEQLDDDVAYTLDPWLKKRCGK